MASPELRVLLQQTEQNLGPILVEKRALAAIEHTRAQRMTSIMAGLLTCAVAAAVAAVGLPTGVAAVVCGVSAGAMGVGGLLAGVSAQHHAQVARESHAQVRELLEAQTVLADPGKRYMLEHGLVESSTLIGRIIAATPGKEQSAWVSRLQTAEVGSPATDFR